MPMVSTIHMEDKNHCNSTKEEEKTEYKTFQIQLKYLKFKKTKRKELKTDSGEC